MTQTEQKWLTYVGVQATNAQYDNFRWFKHWKHYQPWFVYQVYKKLCYIKTAWNKMNESMISICSIEYKYRIKYIIAVNILQKM